MWAWLAFNCFAGALAGCLTNQPAAALMPASMQALNSCWPSTLKATGIPKGCVFASRAFNCAGEAGGIEPDEAELGAATEGLRGMAIEVVAQRQVGILERLRELGGMIAHKGRAVQFEGDVGRCYPVEKPMSPATPSKLTKMLRSLCGQQSFSALRAS